MSKRLIIQGQTDSKGQTIRLARIQYSGAPKTFLISDSKRENVFNPEVWSECLRKTKEAGRQLVVIRWKETGETISASVDDFSLPHVLALQPLKSEIIGTPEDLFKSFFQSAL